MSGDYTLLSRSLMCSLVCEIAIVLTLFIFVAIPGIAAEGVVYELSNWGDIIGAEQVPYHPDSLLAEQTLPRVVTQTEPPFDEPLRIAQLATNTVPSSAEFANVSDPELPPGARNGVFQKLLFTGTWLPRMSGDGLGWSTVDAGVVFALPLMRPTTPLILTPRFAVHYLDSSSSIDLPDQVFDASIEFRHLRRFSNGPWAMDVAVTLGEYSDFEASSPDAFRVTGRGLVVYESDPGVQWILGAAYVNLANVSVLPVAGVIYAPNPTVSWELIMPRPRVAWLLPGSTIAQEERWWYVGAEFSGGLWSIQRPVADIHDVMNYTDYRIMTGYERKIFGDLSRRFEIGYVLGRNLEFQTNSPDISLDDTLFLRVGATY